MTLDSRPTLAHSQYFLTSARLVDRLLSACSIGPADVVYDIGAGKGMITERLASCCRRVVAVERDLVLTAHLRHRFSGVSQVTVLGADFLSINLPRTPFKVFASIPFNITSAIISRLTTGAGQPEDRYLVVQQEAAGRFIGQPGQTLAALLLRPWFEPTIQHRFQRTDFAPVPSVETVLLRLRKRGPPLLGPGEAQVYRDFTTYLFTAWQPSIQATLGAVFPSRQLARICQAAALSPQVTPSAVCFDQWIELFWQFMRTSDPAHRRIIRGAQRRLQVQQARLHKSHRTRIATRYYSERAFHTPRHGDITR